MNRVQFAAILGLLTTVILLGLSAPIHSGADNSPSRIPAVFSGGHDTDPVDKGRPVVLIAAALGVPTAVFREAFSHVQPAPAGTRPDPQQVRRNKAALLQALAPYGVTNERLDEVSDYYRYDRRRGELWPTVEATAYALIKDGKVSGLVVTSGGSGYSSPPTISIPGFDKLAPGATLDFSQAFETNGAVASITLPPGK